MIKVNNVTKTFDGFRALDGLTMTVEQGSIYGLVGPNGAGKSTILRHIMGVYRPDSGSILVDGQPVFENPAVKAKIAVIPDDLNILHTSQIGRVFTYIVRGNPADIKARMAAYQPLLLEALPLSLEEIFIYELGGEDYAVRDIVL